MSNHWILEPTPWVRYLRSSMFSGYLFAITKWSSGCNCICQPFKTQPASHLYAPGGDLIDHLVWRKGANWICRGASLAGCCFFRKMSILYLRRAGPNTQFGCFWSHLAHFLVVGSTYETQNTWVPKLENKRTQQPKQNTTNQKKKQMRPKPFPKQINPII